MVLIAGQKYINEIVESFYLLYATDDRRHLTVSSMSRMFPKLLFKGISGLPAARSSRNVNSIEKYVLFGSTVTWIQIFSLAHCRIELIHCVFHIGCLYIFRIMWTKSNYLITFEIIQCFVLNVCFFCSNVHASFSAMMTIMIAWL